MFGTAPNIQNPPVPNTANTQTQNSGNTFSLQALQQAGNKGLKIPPGTQLSAVKATVEAAGAEFGSRGLPVDLPEGADSIVSCTATGESLLCFSPRKKTAYIKTPVLLVYMYNGQERKAKTNVLSDPDEPNAVSFQPGAPVNVTIVQQDQIIGEKIIERKNVQLA